ncbi:MAG: hypothetical protein ABL921_19680 [Pirellula sp.]
MDQAQLIKILQSTRSLTVTDVTKVAVGRVAMTLSAGSSRNGEKGMIINRLSGYERLQCFVPRTGWEICIATRDLPSEGVPSAYKSYPIRRGTSAIELTLTTLEDGFEIDLLVEDSPKITVKEDRTWGDSTHFMPAHVPAITPDCDTEPLIVLASYKFGTMTKTSAKREVLSTPPITNGILIWLQRVERLPQSFAEQLR